VRLFGEFDPRAQAASPAAVLHAKCIVVDGRHALITSANFTEAASQRTVEAGVLLVDTGLARALGGEFRRLVGVKVLLALPGWV
jgi:phosphatidylserine/phosphatidylglycerophosphate/cardiolipin synthase-like enzyme